MAGARTRNAEDTEALDNLHYLNALLWGDDEDWTRDHVEWVGAHMDETERTTGNTAADRAWNGLRDWYEGQGEEWNLDLLDVAGDVSRHWEAPSDAEDNPKRGGWLRGLASAGLAALGIGGFVMGHKASKGE